MRRVIVTAGPSVRELEEQFFLMWCAQRQYSAKIPMLHIHTAAVTYTLFSLCMCVVGVYFMKRVQQAL
jgi:hypothetical protein